MAKVILELIDKEDGGIDLIVKGDLCCPCNKCKLFPATNAQCAQMAMQDFFKTEAFDTMTKYYIEKYLVDAVFKA